MAVAHVFCLCYGCGVATFVFLFVSVLVGGQWLLGTGAISLSFDGPCGKSRGYEISAKCPDRNTAAGGFDCHHGILSLGSTRERSEDRF